MRISVTAEDIAKGKPRRSCECPVALACMRYGLGVNVSTFECIVYGLREVRVPTPVPVAEFVYRFDRGEPVEPFEFDLEVP